MSHFNFKSLTLYGGMIGSVLLLFKAVTAYGEGNLKASPRVSGTYELISPDLPDCLKDQKLDLTIAQSGIYIFAKLGLSPRLSTQKNEEIPDPASNGKKEAEPSPNKTLTASKPIKLNGLMQSQPFVLKGTTDRLGSCPVASENASQEIALQIKLSERSTSTNKLSGTLSWSGISLALVGSASKNALPQ
jgi:hypothetical protein